MASSYGPHSFWHYIGMREGESVEALIKRQRTCEEHATAEAEPQIEKRVRIQKATQEAHTTTTQEKPTSPPSMQEAWLIFKARARALEATGMPPHAVAARAEQEMRDVMKSAMTYRPWVPTVSPVAARAAEIRKRASEIVQKGITKDLAVATSITVKELDII